MTKDVGLAARHGVLIGDTHDPEVHSSSRLEQERGAGLAEPAMNHVFFDRDDGATFAGRSEHRCAIEWPQ